MFEELADGTPKRSPLWYDLPRGLPTLTTAPMIPEIVSVYIRHKLVSADPGGDATHLALASYYKNDVLLT